LVKMLNGTRYSSGLFSINHCGRIICLCNLSKYLHVVALKCAAAKATLARMHMYTHMQPYSTHTFLKRNPHARTCKVYECLAPCASFYT
jgi:hypothetical protein